MVAAPPRMGPTDMALCLTLSRVVPTVRGPSDPDMSTNPPDLSSLRIRRDEPSVGSRRGGMIAAIVAAVVAAAVAGGWWAIHPRAITVQVAQVASAGGGT